MQHKESHPPLSPLPFPKSYHQQHLLFHLEALEKQQTLKRISSCVLLVSAVPPASGGGTTSGRDGVVEGATQRKKPKKRKKKKKRKRTVEKKRKKEKKRKEKEKRDIFFRGLSVGTAPMMNEMVQMMFSSYRIICRRRSTLDIAAQGKESFAD